MDYSSYFAAPQYPFMGLPSKPEHPYTPQEDISPDPIVQKRLFSNFDFVRLTFLSRRPTTMVINHTMLSISRFNFRPIR